MCCLPVLCWYQLYNSETKRVIMTRDVKWAEWKMIDPEKIVKILCNLHKEDFVPGKLFSEGID